jgi:hypothetical protein
MAHREIADMGVQDVRRRWGTYRSLLATMFTGINDPQKLANAIAVVGPLPAAAQDWGDWVNACSFLIELDTTLAVTDAALRRENDFIAAANSVAAKVTVRAPTALEVDGLLVQLNVVNKRIQQDQRFAAALAIGVAVAGQVREQLARA